MEKKTVIGNGGIGKASALAFSKGYNVVVHAAITTSVAATKTVETR